VCTGLTRRRAWWLGGVWAHVIMRGVRVLPVLCVGVLEKACGLKDVLA
jgi:hypothetical protein